MADVVIDAAGEPESINLAVNLVRPLGHILFFGVPREPVISFDFGRLYRKHCSIITSSTGLLKDQGLAAFKLAVNLIAQREIDVTGLVSHRLPFDRLAEAYRIARTRGDGALKVAVEMSRG